MASNDQARQAPQPVRVGLFGIGLEAYWPQFPGLRDRLEASLAHVQARLERPGVEVVSLGLVDSPEKAIEAGHRLRREDVDLIALYVTTYALSSTVLPAVRRARVPVLVLNLQPTGAIDYTTFNALGNRTQMTGEWLAYCSACPVPEIASVFRRSGVAFHQVTGTLEPDDLCWTQLDDWLAAAQVMVGMEHNRLGLMGHYYGGMLDVYTDLTQHLSTFGGHIDLIESGELAERRKAVTRDEVDNRVEAIRSAFDVQADCPQSELERASRTSVALDALVADHRLGSMAYYDTGAGAPEVEDAISSIILGTSLLTARGIPVAGEYEVKNAQAMKILDLLGAGGSFTEFYATDFRDDVVLMGHDGPGHIAIAQGKTKVRPLGVYHGKVGRGLSVEMAVRHGPVTLLSVVQGEAGRFELLVAEGRSVPGPILEIGNTNSRYRFACGARAFVERWSHHGPAHHCAVGIGHQSARLEKLGALLGLNVVRVV
jgi:L-arabinose isomerase